MPQLSEHQHDFSCFLIPSLSVKPLTILLTNKPFQSLTLNIQTKRPISPIRTLNLYILTYDIRTNGTIWTGECADLGVKFRACLTGEVGE